MEAIYSNTESLIELQPEKTTGGAALVGIQLRLERNRDALNTLALADFQGVELKNSDRRLPVRFAKRGIPGACSTQEDRKLYDANSDVQLLAEQANILAVSERVTVLLKCGR
ncbi:hypothetical protein OH492_28380 [Vibrio chagasii]|nr:hypothetical protein [Vibrio chagasii]